MAGVGVRVAVVVAEREGVTLQELKKKMAEFSRERDWDQFHSPLNLLLALLYCSSVYYSSWGSSNALDKANVKCVGLHVRRINWFALEDITSFLWYKLRNTRRVDRRRHRHRRRRQFQDKNQDFSSSKENDMWDNYHNLNVSRQRKSVSRRRKDRLQSSIYPSSRHVTRSHRHVRLKSGLELPFK